LKSVFGVPVIEAMRHVSFEQARVAGRTSAGRRGGRRGGRCFRVEVDPPV